METIGSITVEDGVMVSVEREETEQGYVYKNWEAFNSGEGICYVPELFDVGYDRAYFDDNFGDRAIEVFETIDWQSPYSYYDELIEYTIEESEE